MRHRIIVALATITSTVLAGAPAATQQASIPTFQVDPYFPKPLPNAWTFGWVAAVFVDVRDHIWLLHVPSSLSQWEDGAGTDPPRALCCKAAPPVVEFDQDGNVVQSWGGPGQGYDWPSTEHALYIDHKDHVWISSSDNAEGQVLKFTRDGQFLMQIGNKTRGDGSNDTTSLGGPAGVVVDPQTNEVIIADGYVNRRVIVFDADSGAYKRHWGAYGEPPDDGPYAYDPNRPLPQQMQAVHCINQSADGLLYVCDRGSNRIQVFQRDGKFIAEVQIQPRTRGGGGSTHGIAFSRDAEQQFLYVADGANHRIWILRRSDLQILGSFGQGGHHAGGFIAPHMLGLDSKGNMYVGESVDGRRIQRFVYTGMGPAGSN